MKVTINSITDFYGEVAESMSIDGKYLLNVHSLCECPEDAIIGRDLVSCNDVLSFMRRAYKAGKDGEEFVEEFTEIEED